MPCSRAYVACLDHVGEQFKLLYMYTGFVVSNIALSNSIIVTAATIS